MSLKLSKVRQEEVSTISGIQFGILSPEEILKRSVVNITESQLYDSSGEPKLNGLFDPRMGIIERKRKCKTCEQTYVMCPGHFGHIELGKPVYYVQFITQIKKILKCVCIRCSKLLINPNDPSIKNIIKKKPEERLDLIYHKVKGFNKICGREANLKTDEAEENDNRGCGAIQPHKYSTQLQDLDYIVAEWVVTEIEDEHGVKIKDKPKQIITPEIALSILKRITIDDCKVLGFSPEWCLPYWLICPVLPVAPPSVRPSVKLYNNQRSEDDITQKYNDIIKHNNILKSKMENKDTSEDQITAYANLIQYHIATLIDNDVKHPAQSRTGRSLKTFKQRLHGKEGRIRNNLMGKRVDFSARSVISPDSNLNIEELGVPKKIAMNLTYPEVVNKYNINKMYQLIRNGAKKYPGAKNYKKESDGYTTNLEFIDTNSIVLEYGDIINRHLIDGDYVLFNRQPSLHKMSMMAHRVRVMEGNTFRLNVDVCEPYNADFDGDEMNMHVPQSIQTTMELKHLAAVPKQIISPSTNSPIIKPSQDNLLGLFKITDDNVFFTQKEFMNLMMGVEAFNGELPEPEINLDNRVRWTGKQTISIIIPNISLDYESDNKYVKNLVIRNGKILQGQISKKSSSKIVHIIFSEYGHREAQRYINDLQKIISRYMIRSGFSVGISDLIVHQDIREKNEQLIIKAKQDVVDMTKQVHLNIFENVSKGVDELYEAKIQKVLGKAEKDIEHNTTDLLDMTNRVNYIVTSGSKGEPKNISQMSCLLAQQKVDGKRIPLGFLDRSLPHYSRYDNGIESRGFIVNNFKDGLTPQEFFFHAMAGREGLIDTAVKTAKSGYLQRKLIKATEDLKANHDYTVRNSNGNVVQFVYGEDGFNPIYLESQSFDNLMLIKSEKMENDFLFDIDMDWSLYMTHREINNMKKMADWKQQMEKYNTKVKKAIIDLHESFRSYIEKNDNKCGIDIQIYFPVNFKRLINNARKIFHLNGKNKSDVSPLHIVNAFDKLYKHCVVNNKTNMILEILLIDKLSPIKLVRDMRITKVALDHIINQIKIRFKRSLVQGGEMVGPVAAQSIGQISTQLTLNSVEWNTDMLFQENGKSKVVKMGEFIDTLMNEKLNKSKIQYIPKNRTEYLELESTHQLYVPSVNKLGDMEWCEVTAVTRHLPVGELVRITTESGREVTATQQKSFLIWNEEKQEIITSNGNDLKIGDLVPTTKDLPNSKIIQNTLDISTYLPKTEWLYGTDFNYAGHLYCSDERNRKIGFWAMNGDDFTLPYSRGDTFIDAWQGNRMKGTTIKCDCIYPKKCIRVPSEIPDTWILNEQLGFIVGIYLAEGWATDTFVGISNNSDIIRKKVTDWCDSMKVSYHLVISTNKRFEGSQSSDLKIHSVLLARFFKKWMGTGSSNKKIPDEAFTGSLDFAKGILDGYISGDGCVSKTDGSINASSVSKDLIVGISTLCNRFGIFGKISGHQAKKNNVNSKNIKYSHTLYIRNGYAQIFAKDISLTHPEKKEKLNNITLVKEYKDFSGKWKFHNNIILDPIKKIEFVTSEKECVYDLTVPKTLNFTLFSGLSVVDTFHYAGVGEKSNVNQGVPRLEELMENRTSPKKPELHIMLSPEYRKTKEKAEQAQYNLELVRIADILKSDAIYLEPTNDLDNVLEEDKEIMKIYQIFSELDQQSQQIPNNPWIIRLEFNRREMVNKKIMMEDINLILKQHLPTASIIYTDDNSGKLIFRLRITFDSNASKADDDINLLSDKIDFIKNIVIKGVEGIEKVYAPYKNCNLLVKEGETYTTETEYYLKTSGSNLFDVLTKQYVDSTRTTSINISEVYQVLGIEGARWMLNNQFNDVFTKSSKSTSLRHIGLLCDIMTNRGKIMPANRTGINQTDNDIGPLAKSSFEETTERLKRAGIFGDYDKINGVSSNIMVGQIPKCGTGDSEILLDEEKLAGIIEEEDIVEEQEEDISKILQSSDYCNDNQSINFNINAIQADNVRLNDLPEITIDL